MSRTIRIFALSGSLRAKSLNSAALRACRALAPAGVEIEIGTIAGIPVYNDDDKQAGLPPAVESLCRSIRAADAVLIATPEYNYSIPGPLKNAIDWVSRAAPPPFVDKPVAILGVSPGMIGTARAQYDLRKVFVFLDARLINKPEVMIGGAAGKFDADGNLTDPATQGFVVKQIEALRDWALRLHPTNDTVP